MTEVMKNIDKIEFHTGSREELLPNYADSFPYIASRVELDKHIGRSVPWHWHRAIEIFYIESGGLECYTPRGKMLFPAASGCMVNSNVLHMIKALSHTETNVPLVHLFDVSMLAGKHGSRIEQKYIMPIVTATQIEMIPLFPENPAHKKILNLIFEAFHIPDDKFGYEIKLQEALLEIWLMLFEQSIPVLNKKCESNKNSDRIKQMMIYIHEHYAEKISIRELAAAAFLSERECFRIFHECLHLTPIEYMRSYRLQMACQMLANGDEPITCISHACGLGSSSYFGKTFREYTGYTPMQYRMKWRNSDI